MKINVIYEEQKPSFATPNTLVILKDQILFYDGNNIEHSYIREFNEIKVGDKATEAKAGDYKPSTQEVLDALSNATNAQLKALKNKLGINDSKK